jgi:hypothetical protein
MLLQHGVSYNSSNNTCADHGTAMLAQYVDWLREQTTQRQKLLQAHVAGIYTMNDMNSDITSANKAAKLQLINADTGITSSSVYTVDTTLLHKLHAATEQPVSTGVLLNMLLPTKAWATTSAVSETRNTTNCDMTTSDASPTTLISYNGECTYIIS